MNPVSQFYELVLFLMQTRFNYNLYNYHIFLFRILQFHFLAMQKLCLLLLLTVSLPILEAAHKCVWVTGVLKCRKNARNHANVEVRVYDKDGVSIFQAIDPDDIMG